MTLHPKGQTPSGRPRRWLAAVLAWTGAMSAVAQLTRTIIELILAAARLSR